MITIQRPLMKGLVEIYYKQRLGNTVPKRLNNPHLNTSHKLYTVSVNEVTVCLCSMAFLSLVESRTPLWRALRKEVVEAEISCFHCGLELKMFIVVSETDSSNDSWSTYCFSYVCDHGTAHLFVFLFQIGIGRKIHIPLPAT